MRISERERLLLRILVILLIVWLSFEVVQLAYQAFLRVAEVVVIFVSAWTVAYLLTPTVDAITERTRLGRLGAVALVYAAIAVVLAGLGVIAVPALAAQLGTIRDRGPELAENARLSASGLQDALDRARIGIDIQRALGTIPQRVGDTAGAFAADALGVVSATATIFFNTSLVLIIAFLMLLDGPHMWRRFIAALTPELRSEAELFRQSADRAVGGFVRGSLLLGAFYGVVTLAYLVPLGIPFAGVLSVVAGLTVMIPFFGPIIAFFPVMLVTLLGAPDRLLIVFGLTILLQQITLNVVGPRVIGTAIGIHPLFVFLALLLGSRLAGFWGVLLAMPIAGIMATFVRYAYELARGRRERTEAAQLMVDTE